MIPQQQSDNSMLPNPSDEQVRLWDEIENNLNPEKIEEIAIFQNLPENVRKQATSYSNSVIIKKISEKYKIDKETRLSYIIYLIILGKINITNFVSTLREKCQLDETIARQLAREINKQIFLPIKDELKKIHQVPNWPREEEKIEKPKPTEIPGSVVNLKNSN